MAETISSPGVTTTEIDLSGPSQAQPSGIPAGIIGTSNEGPAFVPLTVGTFTDFMVRFGESDGEKFGPLAVSEWLKKAQSCTFIRVLGAGDGKKRNSTTGKVTNAGFLVGGKLPQANGNLGANTYANTGPLGRTYFLGCFMSESNGSTIFRDGGIQKKGSSPDMTASMPILRGVLMAPSGVILKLSSSRGNNAAPAATARANEASEVRGSITGSAEIGSQEFVMFLNGHKGLDAASPRVITASFDMNGGNYFADTLNTDPTKIEEKGHFLYTHYDIHPALAAVTGTGRVREESVQNYGGSGTWEPIAFITTGALARDTSNASIPNYESFEDRFQTTESPYIISQAFGGVAYDLFKVVSIDDGFAPNTRVKISIENLAKSTSDTNLFGSFDIVVRDFFDTDEEKVVMEAYRGVNLDPSSTRFAPRVVGDQTIYFDFDKATASQKLVVEGDHPTNSNYIRLKQSNALDAGEVPDNALPLGFRGIRHLVTSGSEPLTEQLIGAGGGVPADMYAAMLKQTRVPPIPMRENLSIGTDPTKRVMAKLYWGIQFDLKTKVSEPNSAALLNRTIVSHAKFFPMFHPTNRNVMVGDNVGVADSGGVVLDSDKFNNNKFTLENISVRTGTDGLADALEWVSASYHRNGTIDTSATDKTRRFKIDDLGTSANRNYAKFTLILQGGFDGVNIFDKDKKNLTNNASKREMDDSDNQGGTAGPTVGSFRKAIDVMGNKSDVNIKLLAIPGMRHTAISDYAIDVVENRFDAMYIMDIEERDTLNNVVTSSDDQVISVGNTVTSFKNRGLDTSFGAAYFPDCVVTDPVTLTNVRVPPSVVVLGAFSLNDAVGHPWFAPAGFTRGALNSTLFASVDLNRANLDDLYDGDVNPITDFPGTGVVVWGQKTLLATQSSLDRVNVRRLLIEIRRSVRAIADTLLFEPNRTSTLDKFSGLVNPLLQSIQDQSGLDRFKVIIDTTTTTQADVENNTIRGKIFLQPTRTAEFISLDFVVTNAGTEI